MPHKLLLADDSVTIQRVIELTFADEDVQVVAVGDGKKAIASIQSDRPDIVLADVGMPERDGYEVAAFIKGNPQFSNIPVLLLTGAFEPIDETRARAVGCDGVLVKPFEPQMVINRVKDLLAGRRPSSLWSANPPAQSPTRQPDAASRGKEVNLQPSVPREAQVATGGSLEDYFDRLDAAFATVEGAAEAQTAPVSAAPPPIHPAAAAPAARPLTPTAFSPVDLGDWDPDLAGDPEKPAVVLPPPTPVAAPPPVPVAAAPPPSAPVAAAPPPVPVAAAPPPSVPVTAAPPPAAAAPPPPPLATSRAPQAPPLPVAPAPSVPYSPPSPAPALARPEPPATSAVSTAAVSPAPAMPSLAEAFAALLSAEQSRSISPSTIGASAVSDDTVDDIVRRVIARLGDQAVRDTVVDVAERLVREEIARIKGS
jgi:CheY-like chemotaxis protein